MRVRVRVYGVRLRVRVYGVRAKTETTAEKHAQTHKNENLLAITKTVFCIQTQKGR